MRATIGIRSYKDIERSGAGVAYNLGPCGFLYTYFGQAIFCSDYSDAWTFGANHAKYLSPFTFSSHQMAIETVDC